MGSATRLLAFVVAAAICGCSVYHPVDIIDESRPIADLGQIRVVGHATGSSCQRFIAFIPITPAPPLNDAYLEAIRSVGATSLINVTADQVDTSVLAFYAQSCVTVRGDGVVRK